MFVVYYMLNKLTVLFIFKRYEESLADFQQAFKALRGNQLIDYKTLGLRYKLYACEVSIQKHPIIFLCFCKASLFCHVHIIRLFFSTQPTTVKQLRDIHFLICLDG